MKKLAIVILALAVSGAAYAGDPSTASGFSLAIGRAPAAPDTPQVPLRPETGGLGAPNSAATGIQASSKGNLGLAEFYLGRLSRSQKSSRQVWGGIMMAGGIAGIVLGAGMASLDEEEAWIFAGLGKAFGYVFILSGSALTVGGIISLVAPSGAERDYREAMRIEDPEQRERACRLALPELASHGRTSRIISGVVCSVLAGVCVAGATGDEGASSLSTAALFGGLAAYSFLAKSPAEKALRNYEREAGENKITQLGFGFGPRGRIQATLLIAY